MYISYNLNLPCGTVTWWHTCSDCRLFLLNGGGVGIVGATGVNGQPTSTGGSTGGTEGMDGP